MYIIDLCTTIVALVLVHV